MERWRDLYRAATEQRDDAWRVIALPNRSREDSEAAKQREREALREIDLLLNRGSATETDFYPYRYLANEGFLPGYNFPRLPLRALVSVRDDAHTVDRPRFLGLSEFGPWNVIYHEGRKHRVESCILPAGGIDSRLTHARICTTCGYIHPGEAASVDLCAHCGTPLNGANSEYHHGLLDQPTVRTRRRDRISSDEEERAREGYAISTHYRFSSTERERHASVVSPSGQPLLEVRYAPQAELWRINNGWRRASGQDGFTIDPESGKWQRREDDDHDAPPDPAANEVRSGIRPYVTDSRNILLLRPITETPDREAFLKTLSYAFQRGIQFVYQVEEQEIAVELIGKDAHMRLLLWEAAEGGVGVWERILSERDAVAKIAREALRMCHFDGETGEEDAAWHDTCAVACYDCLLSYSNQSEHRHLNRHLVRDYLLALAGGSVQQGTGERDYDAQYRWLYDRTDPASSLEREFLDYLHGNHLRLPDHAQYRLDGDISVQADFYFDREGLPGSVVFVDGPHHDDTSRREHDREVREQTEDRGYKVVVVRYDRPFAEQWIEPSP